MVEAVWYLLAVVGAVAGSVLGLVLHELAHAAPLVLAGGSVRVTIGSDSGRTIHVGPLTITVGVDGVRTFMQYGYYEPNRRHSLRVRAVSIVSGPLMTVGIVSVLGVMLYRGVGEPLFFVLTFVFFNELYRAIQTIVPKTYSRGPYRGMQSDGKRFLKLVRSRSD